MIRFALALAALLCAGPAVAGEMNIITGHAYVIDGDTLDIDHIRIRLAGMDAPERNQICRGAAPQSQEIACGLTATARMRDLTAGSVVACISSETDRYGRLVARCRTDKTPDLGEAMVRDGWAIRWPRYDSQCRYCDADAEARRDHRGMWAGEFTMPWEYRHREKEEKR